MQGRFPRPGMRRPHGTGNPGRKAARQSRRNGRGQRLKRTKSDTIMEKKIGIACDHAGYEMKEFLVGCLGARGYDVHDFGTYSEERDRKSVV